MPRGARVDPALLPTNGYDFRNNVDGDTYAFLAFAGAHHVRGWVSTAAMLRQHCVSRQHRAAPRACIPVASAWSLALHTLTGATAILRRHPPSATRRRFAHLVTRQVCLPGPGHRGRVESRAQRVHHHRRPHTPPSGLGLWRLARAKTSTPLTGRACCVWSQTPRRAAPRNSLDCPTTCTMREHVSNA